MNKPNTEYKEEIIDDHLIEKEPERIPIDFSSKENTLDEYKEKEKKKIQQKKARKIMKKIGLPILFIVALGLIIYFLFVQ